MSEPKRYIYEFGDFRLDAARRLLFGRDGAAVSLTPKALDTLIYLVERSGAVLDKDELMRAVWPDTIVEENNLSQCISALRRALGEKPGHHRYVVTMPGRGFCFVAAVSARADEGLSERARSDAPDAGTERPEAVAAVARRTASPAGVPKNNVRLIALACLLAAGLGVTGFFLLRARSKTVPTSPAPSVAPVKTIAVLPFKSLVAESRDESIEMGMCDALIRRLSGISQLVVRPTSSVVVYNKPGQDPLAIGRELGVNALLDGYVQRSDDRIRVTAQLLRVADGKHLWSGQFDEYFTNIFAVEDSISGQMVEALSLELTGEEQRRVSKHYTENAEAYTLYLKGWYFLNKKTADGLKKSIEKFQQAIEKDPNYALAWAGLAESYSGLPIRAKTPPQDSYQAAKAAAMRALEIDDTIAEAHASLANVKYSYDWDWSGAEGEFKRAIELNPNYLLARQSYTSYLISTGRHEQAISEAKRAQALDPLSLFGNVHLSRIFYFAGRYDEAAGECLKALEMDSNYGVARLFLGKAYKQKGMYKEALAELEKAKDLLGNDSEALSQIGYTYAVWGRRVEAQMVLEELQESSKQSYVSPYHIAMVYAGLGQRDKTFEWLEMAYERREARMNILKYAPEFGGLHSDPRFADLVRRVGLP